MSKNIIFYEIPNYFEAPTNTPEIIPQRIIKPRVTHFESLLSEDKINDTCYHELLHNTDIIKMNIDIDGTPEDIEEIYQIVLDTANQLFNIKHIDVHYTTNFGYNKGGNSHHLTIPMLSCEAKSQIKFWQYIEQQHPDKEFKFDYGHLKSSKKFFRLPYQNKEKLDGTSHYIIYGESESFVLTYIDRTRNITTIINKIFPDIKPKAHVSSIDTDATDIDLIRIEEFTNILNIEYINNYADWIIIIWALRSLGEKLKTLAKTLSQKSTKYSEDGFDKIWDDYTGNKFNKLTKNTFYHYCKLSNEEEYKKLCKKYCIASEIVENELDTFYELDLAGIETKVETTKYIGCDENNEIIYDRKIHNSKHVILYASLGKG